MTVELPGRAQVVLDVLATTRAIRRYRADDVTEEQLATLLFAASRAPSGSNRQPFRFVVLRRNERTAKARRLIAESAHAMWSTKRSNEGYDQGSGVDENSPKARMARSMAAYVEGLESVPVMILACLIRVRDPNPYEGAGVYPACQNLLVAARAIGLGGVLTTWHVGAEAELRTELGIPDDVFIAATITIGTPVGRHGPVRRRPLSELVFEDRWAASPTWAVDPPGTAYTAAGPPRS